MCMFLAARTGADPTAEDANCIDALGRIEGRMGELLACMTELAGNLKEPSPSAAKKSGVFPPVCRTWRRARRARRAM